MTSDRSILKALVTNVMFISQLFYFNNKQNVQEYHGIEKLKVPGFWTFEKTEHCC